MRSQIRANATKKDGFTHVGPYDAVFCILRRDALEAAGLSSSSVAHFAAHWGRTNATNEQVELVLIPLRHSPCHVGGYFLTRDVVARH